MRAFLGMVPFTVKGLSTENEDQDGGEPIKTSEKFEGALPRPCALQDVSSDCRTERRTE